MSLYIPQPGTIRARVVQLVMTHDCLTMLQICERFPAVRSNIVRKAIEALEGYDALVKTDNGYCAAQSLIRYYNESQPDVPEYVPQIVGPRDRPIFREIATKNLAHLNPLIADRLRQVSFVTLSSNVPFAYVD